MQNWYLVYTKPKNEEAVATRFLESGFNVLNPKFKERRYIRGRTMERLSQLFPCYIFVRFDIFRSYRLVKYTRGVRRVVGTENVPTAVSGEIVQSIRERMVDGVITVKPPEFAQGEEVQIKGGHLQGLDALFERRLKGSERVMVLLKTMNARVVIDSALLSRANGL